MISGPQKEMNEIEFIKENFESREMFSQEFGGFSRNLSHRAVDSVKLTREKAMAKKRYFKKGIFIGLELLKLRMKKSRGLSKNI
jgi:hypothetical protein